MSVFNLILGSGSPLGEYLVRHLPHGKVRGFQRSDASDQQGSCYFCLGENEKNLASFENAIGKIREHHLCVVMIAYFREPSNGVNPGDYEIEALNQLITLGVSAGKTISVLLCSSISVYGPTEVDPLTEDCTLNPQNDYAKAKLAVEQYIQKCCDEGLIKSGLIARIPCLVGKGFRGNFLKDIVDSSVNGKVCEVSFIDSPFNSIVDYETIRKLVDYVGQQKIKNTEILNVASWPPTTLRHVLDKAKCSYNEVNNYPNPPKLIDASRLMALLGAIKSSEETFGEIL